MSENVESFYDGFSATFVGDYVRGNRRCERQHRFFSDAIPKTTTAVLVIGCGSGQGAHYIATRVAKQANVLAIDISAENLRLARALFPHPRIEYRKVDVVAEHLEGVWDIIAFPDVYEHIPRQMRTALHAKLDKLLAPRGRILLTVPTPAGQAETVASGGKLQIVDEPVTLSDLTGMAGDVHAVVSYYAQVSIWRTNDYAYAVVERGSAMCRPVASADRIALKGFPPKNPIARTARAA
ncbi:MAG: class I SAM-dependent methyltransferase, partial [Gammaproteobacteria bacterium]